MRYNENDTFNSENRESLKKDFYDIMYYCTIPKVISEINDKDISKNTMKEIAIGIQLLVNANKVGISKEYMEDIRINALGIFAAMNAFYPNVDVTEFNLTEHYKQLDKLFVTDNTISG